MRAGKLRHLITLEKEVQVDNGFHGFTTTFVPFRKVWARIKPLTGREVYQAHQTKAIINHEITIRRISGLGNGTYFGSTYWGDHYFGRSYWGGDNIETVGSELDKMEVVHRGRRFRILKVLNHEEQNERITLGCEEIPA